MVVFLIRSAIYLVSAALGLVVAALIVDDVHLTAGGFVVALIIFLLAQWILTPLVMKMTRKYANAFIGGVGIVSTFVALLIASIIGDGLSITGGIGPWVLAAVIVWLVTAIATLVLPMIFLRNRVQDRKGGGAR
jgi:hypothetical protein